MSIHVSGSSFPSEAEAATAAQRIEELKVLARYQRATNYLAAAQIYLQDNVLLQSPLTSAHVKDRLLGHWGTCPGINMIYAHLNQLIIHHDLNMLLVTGPGHGAPANLANLYLEGSLENFYPTLSRDQAGVSDLVRRFSWPGGFPSHLAPAIPGTIHEGGELGYALATAFGAAMDNPDLIVACIVGDGEAETGATTASWHSYKFLDPAESGAVLPILHLNGHKISNPTIYGTMDDTELTQLFSGFGYHVSIVEATQGDAVLAQALDHIYAEIRQIQQAARSGYPLRKPAWPMLILRSPKGWTGIKSHQGKQIESSHRSHQIPAADLKENPESLQAVETWLRSYRPEELFDEQGRPAADLLTLCPSGNRRMGCNKHTLGGNLRQELQLPDLTLYAVPAREKWYSNVGSVARYLRDVIAQNPHTFRIFSPDELESNMLGEVLEVTQRNYQWPVTATDYAGGTQGGRVIEVLSEHMCQAWLQGYLLTGRHGLFPSYEAFLPIIASMMDQYAKFLKMSGELSWRPAVPSLNYLLTSTLWRQEHNGFSHQNPGFINTLANKKGDIARAYFPPDANCLLYLMDHCLRGYDSRINLIIAEKRPFPQWLSLPDAIAHCRAGLSVWRWASTENGIRPDVVLVGIGDNPTVEVMAAAQMLSTDLPELRIRVVNVIDLLALSVEHPHTHSAEHFESVLTKEKPVIINFHGYPSVIKQLLFGRPYKERFLINGYCEEGTTTTPFDMQIRNGTDRYHLAIQAIQLACNESHDAQMIIRMNERICLYETRLAEHRQFIQEHGKDPDEIVQWRWH